MDLWDALGISATAGIWIAAVGVGVAVLVAVGLWLTRGKPAATLELGRERDR